MVYRRGKIWWFAVRLNGMRYRRPVREATTKTQAIRAETRFKGELLAGRYDLADQSSDITFSVLAKKFLGWSKENRKSWRSDQSRIKPLVESFGDKGLREISPIMVERFKSERRQSMRRGKKPRNPATVNRELALLRRVLNLAIQNKWLRANPVSSVKFLREERDGRQRYVTLSEEAALLKACSAPSLSYLKPFVMVALGTGMRKGELLNLTWDRVDFESGYILVTQTESGRDRTVPINSLVRSELLKLQETSESEYVFANPLTDEPYSDLKRSFVTACKKAKVEGVVFHTLRHTAASRMVAAGIDLVTVKEILGHTDIATTMRYSHAMPERKISAVEVLAKQTEQALQEKPENLETEQKRPQLGHKLRLTASAQAG